MTTPSKRVGTQVFAFAGGGTGGHLFPAMAVAEALLNQLTGAEVVFLASNRAIDKKILDPTHWTWYLQEVQPFRPQPWRWLSMVRGWRSAMRLCKTAIREHRPGVVVGSGGFASVPGLLTAHRMGIPTAILNPDFVPGRATRYLSNRVDRIFVQWEESKVHFAKAKDVRATGCPVRRSISQAVRIDGITTFGLDPKFKILLITGASLGARSVNEAIVAALPILQRESEWQMLHLTGDADCVRVTDAYHRLGVLGKVLPFTDKMSAALACADLVVARAGASTLAEITAAGKPSILLPYPHHRDMHQLANARVLEGRGGAKIVIDRKDSARNMEPLLEALLPLMRDPDMLARMGAKARAIGRPNAADEIAEQLISMSARAD